MRFGKITHFEVLETIHIEEEPQLINKKLPDQKIISKERIGSKNIFRYNYKI